MVAVLEVMNVVVRVTVVIAPKYVEVMKPVVTIIATTTTTTPTLVMTAGLIPFRSCIILATHIYEFSTSQLYSSTA